MTWDEKHIDYKVISNTGTTSTKEEQYKYKVVQFDRYLVKIKLTMDDKFVDIEEISVKRSFVNKSRMKSNKIYVDVDKYYKDE